MDRQNYASTSVPVCVIDPLSMVPYAINIIFDTSSPGDHLITDVNNKILFKVKPYHTAYHNQLVLLDVKENTIVTLRKKIRSLHSRWNAFRGDSKDDSDLLFSVKKENIIQSKTNLHVFLANKQSSNKECDFKITGSWSKRKCSICMRDSLIAQMCSMQKPRFGKDRFMVNVYPNVDYAFVIALIAIIEAMKSSSDDDHHHNPHIGDVAHVAEAASAVAQVIGTALSQ